MVGYAVDEVVVTRFGEADEGLAGGVLERGQRLGGVAVAEVGAAHLQHAVGLGGVIELCM